MQIAPDFFANEGVRRVFETLEAYQPGSVRAVGGCVRDAIMNRPVNDIDFATPVTPDVVTDLFTRAGFHVEPTGIEHGTVTVIWDHEPFEVTTLRRDVETDGRRAVVAFSTDWAEDAYRRDFRFNALYLGQDGTVYDYSPDEGGIKDALERRIAFMGDAEQRIREDYLRILRLFRFQSVLNAKVDQAALDAAAKLKDGIDTLSGERLEKEIVKLLDGDNFNMTLFRMGEAGLLTKALALDPVADETLLAAEMGLRLNRLRGIRKLVKKPVLGSVTVLAVALGWNVDAAERLLTRWKSSNAMREAVIDMIRLGPVDVFQSREAYTKEAYRTGRRDLTDRRVAMTWAVWPESEMTTAARLLNVVLPTFPVQGRDVLALGVKPGKEVGRILRAVEERWVDAGFPDEAEVREMLKEEVESVGV